MLRVKTTVKESTVPGIGLGLFAAEPIAKGTLIWKFNEFLDVVIPDHRVPYMSRTEQAFIKKYAYRVGRDFIICADDGRFINHSKSPNVDDIANAEVGSISVANRDISAGEELFCDYTTFHDDYRNGVNF